MPWTKETLPLPTQVSIELQADCNRNCFFCPRQGDSSGKRRNPDSTHVKKAMPTEWVLKFLDQLQEMNYTGLVFFRHLSEAFLDPRLMDILREAKKRGFVLGEATNGDVLQRNDDIARQSNELYDFLSIGLYDYNSPEEKEVKKEFWRKRLPDVDLSFSEYENVIWRTHTQYDPRMTSTPRAFPDSPCLRPLKGLFVHYDGSIPICCDDMLCEYGLGNAFETHLRDIWFSQRHVQILNDLEAGKRYLYPRCKLCHEPAYQLERRIFTTRARHPETGIQDVRERRYADDAALLHALQGKRILVWGTGALYRERFQAPLLSLNGSATWLGFVDNNPDAWETTLDGRPVAPPQRIRELAPDTILVASAAALEIATQIYEMDIPNIEVVTP